MAAPKKLYELHFRASESDGERFLIVVDRLGAVKAHVLRDAVLAYVLLAESAPSGFTRHELALHIERAIARAALESSDPRGARVTSPNLSRPSRPGADTKAHKRT